MTDRMTDERLAEIEACWEDTPEWNWEAIAQELIQALKAWRKLALEATACRFAAASGSRLPIAKNRCDVRIEKQEKRIRELEDALNEIRREARGYGDFGWIEHRCKEALADD